MTVGSAETAVEATFTATLPASPEVPETTIGHLPHNAKPAHTHFRFRSSIKDSTFNCSLDGGAPQSCRSPQDYRNLEPGRHVFRVAATAPNGQTDASPARARFQDQNLGTKRGAMTKARSGPDERQTPDIRRALALMIATATAAAGALALAPAANGATLYSNLAGGGSDSSGTGQVDTTAQRIAQPFVASASGTARLVGFYGVSYLNSPATVSISIYSNNAGQPGTALATGAQAVIGDSSTAVPTCTALSGVGGAPLPSLTAGQTYWAVFQTYHNTAFWSTASQGGGAPKVSSNSGASWGAATSQHAQSSSTTARPASPTSRRSRSQTRTRTPSSATCTPSRAARAFRRCRQPTHGVAELKLTAGSFSAVAERAPEHVQAPQWRAGGPSAGRHPSHSQRPLAAAPAASSSCTSPASRP